MAMIDYLLRDLISLTDAMETGNRKPESGERGGAAGRMHHVSPGADATTLRYIVQERASGVPFSSIAAYLNKLGSRGRNGARWYSASVRSFLQRYARI